MGEKSFLLVLKTTDTHWIFSPARCKLVGCVLLRIYDRVSLPLRSFHAKWLWFTAGKVVVACVPPWKLSDFCPPLTCTAYLRYYCTQKQAARTRSSTHLTNRSINACQIKHHPPGTVQQLLPFRCFGAGLYRKKSAMIKWTIWCPTAVPA